MKIISGGLTDVPTTGNDSANARGCCVLYIGKDNQTTRAIPKTQHGSYVSVFVFSNFGPVLQFTGINR